MVQYLQNNVMYYEMDYSFYSFYWLDSLEIRLDHNSTYYRSLSKNSNVVFHIAIPKTSNIRGTPSFDLLTDEFSKRVSIIRRALYQRQDGSYTAFDVSVKYFDPLFYKRWEVEFFQTLIHKWPF